MKMWRARTVALAVVAASLAACVGATAPTSSGPPPGDTSLPPGSVPSDPGAAASSPRAAPTQTGTPAATPSKGTTATATPTTDPTMEPPPAALLVAGAVEQSGEPGGYTWGSGSQSAPWLPASALDRVTVSAASIEIRVDAPVDEWTAQLAHASDPAGSDVDPIASGVGRISFPTPASGDWVVAVDATFSGGAGGAAYYWHVVVP